MNASARFLTAILLVLAAARLHAADATISWSVVKQDIDGFGVSSAWLGSNLSTTQADMFFSPTSGIGLSLLRIRVAPGASTGAAEIDAGKKAVARGARVWATPWSPKAAYKSNNSVNNGGNLLPASYAAYASDMVAYVRNLQTQGVNLYALSLQNEPDLATPYESCNFSGQQLHDYLAVLGPAFATAGLATKLLLPEHSNGQNGHADASLNDPVTRAYAGLIGQHQYGGNISDYPLARACGVKTWETEVCELGTPWDASMNSGLQTARWLHQSLVTCSNSAFHFWWVWNINNTDNNEGLLRGTDHTTTSKRFWILGNYSRFIRPGWVRIDASEQPSGGVLVSAYKNPANGAFVVVATNTNGAAVPLTFHLDGISPSTVTPWVTDNGNDLAAQTALPVSGGAFTCTLSGPSVTTFVGSVGDPGKPYITCNPSALHVSAEHGQDAAAQTIAVGNASAGTLASLQPGVAYGSGSGWLSASASGSGNAQTINLQFASSGLGVGIYTATVSVSDPAAVPTSAACTVTLTVNRGPNDPVAINAGGPALAAFAADQGFSGGSTYTSTNTVSVAGVANAAPAAVYLTSRWGAMTCTIPGLQPNTPCTVRLHFAESYWSSAGGRLFNVDLNGSRILTNLDLFVAAGGKDRALVRDFTTSSDANGQIQLGFSNVVDNASINGIEVIPGGGATKPGDANTDGSVDAADIAIVTAQFGRNGAEIGDIRADLDGDGRVDAVDLGIVTRNQGR